jgi:hypothetical protein
MGRNAHGQWGLRRPVFGGGVVVRRQVVQDSFVEGGEHVELSRGKQANGVPADVSDRGTPSTETSQEPGRSRGYRTRGTLAVPVLRGSPWSLECRLA